MFEWLIFVVGILITVAITAIVFRIFGLISYKLFIKIKRIILKIIRLIFNKSSE